MRSCSKLSDRREGPDPGSQGDIIANAGHPDSPAWPLQALVTESTSADPGVDGFLEGERQGSQVFG
ncbi:hypothetical protein [Arthrobacter sp. OV608]|uniref:hypothetical protein n=1 Tax=Arthrobacter sp. OV608 TaxID=1882768 RepID=UPI002570C3EC|nr:hypothetical protein [Arthrobacter sp. OV608]